MSVKKHQRQEEVQVAHLAWQMAGLSLFGPAIATRQSAQTSVIDSKEKSRMTGNMDSNWIDGCVFDCVYGAT